MTETEKCVIVLREDLPAGVAANTAAILGITLGQRRPDLVGPDAPDGGGKRHPGIIQIPVPVLRADGARLREIQDKLETPKFQGVTAVDFSALAQGCRTYGEFLEKMAGAAPDSLEELGLLLCGDAKQVNRLTGSLPLMR